MLYCELREHFNYVKPSGADGGDGDGDGAVAAVSGAVSLDQLRQPGSLPEMDPAFQELRAATAFSATSYWGMMGRLKQFLWKEHCQIAPTDCDRSVARMGRNGLHMDMSGANYIPWIISGTDDVHQYSFGQDSDEDGSFQYLSCGTDGLASTTYDNWTDGTSKFVWNLTADNAQVRIMTPAGKYLGFVPSTGQIFCNLDSKDDSTQATTWYIDRMTEWSFASP